MSEAEEDGALWKWRMCIGGALIGCCVAGSVAGLFGLPFSATEWKGSIVGGLVVAVILFFPRPSQAETEK